MERDVRTCKTCGAEIVWLKTALGKNIPVDDSEAARSYKTDEAEFNPLDADLVTHFATCPHAAMHRSTDAQKGYPCPICDRYDCSHARMK